MQSLPKKPSLEPKSSNFLKSSKSDPNINNPTFKRAKLYNSRQIRTQLQDDSFTNPPKGSKTSRKLINNASIIPNKLNIPEFLAAREFEIKALDSAIIKSKTSGASRVFQALPRTLRRRTASHNVRRIPKRMRKKALREMGLQLNSNGINEMIGTKGVTISGKPIKSNIGRGRLRWQIIRKIKLLKYATKWKLKGRLPNSQYVSYSQINLRKKLKLLKKDLNKLNDNNSNDDDDENNLVANHKNSTVINDSLKIKNLENIIKNNLYSYDNTTVNKLSKISKVNCVKYISRQKYFKWLPTHIWHAKRAKMMKRWEWIIPNEPTQRCYRSISRSSRLKGAIVFDTSYIGSIVINAYNEDTQKTVINYIEKITNNRVNVQKCIKKSISWDGYIYNLKESIDPIGRVTLVFVKSNDSLRVLLRLHPSIHSICFNLIVDEFNEIENISVHDCKYSIGSIDITGPKSITALQSIFLCEKNENGNEQFNKFMNLHKLNDLTSIPDGTIFTFNVRDPRFRTKHGLPTNPKLSYNEQLDLIIELKNKNIINDDLLKPETRANTYNNQLSLKELGKRRYLHPGETIPINEKDSLISIMLIKSYETWTLVLPWFWVLPFWHSIVHVPHIKFGGFKQLEQLRFERGLLGWYDIVFSSNGYIQCELEREEAERKWNKRPKSKRITYDKLKIENNGELLGEVLSPFGLDWRSLQTLRMVVKYLTKENKLIDVPKINKLITDNKINIIPQSLKDISVVVKAIQVAEKQMKDKNMHSLLLQYKPITLAQDCNIAVDLSQISFNIKDIPPLPIVAVNLICLNKGNVKPNARIYSIKEEFKDFWININEGHLKNIRGCNVRVGSLDESGNYNPKIQDLVGLVSSASFSLVDGKSVAIGFIDAEVAQGSDSGVFLVRNVASNTYTAMKWSRIDLTK
jgi:ribonuclease P/MRP protein subunit POP1